MTRFEGFDKNTSNYRKRCINTYDTVEMLQSSASEQLIHLWLTALSINVFTYLLICRSRVQSFMYVH